jgi:hypothetical protein
MRATKQLLESMRAKGFVTVTEAAKIAMRMPRTIRRWRNRGHISNTTNGGICFIELASLRKWTGEQEPKCE